MNDRKPAKNQFDWLAELKGRWGNFVLLAPEPLKEPEWEINISPCAQVFGRLIGDRRSGGPSTEKEMP